MKGIEINWSSLKDTKPHEYAVRFVFGGLATVLAGLIAKRYGPGIRGLFLAFPAIFPANATLIEGHEKKRKAAVGSDGRPRGRMAASLDSSGASLGCVGLMGFAYVLWRWLEGHNAWLMISIATAIWLSIAYLLWNLREHRPRKRRGQPRKPRTS
jgi:hypothetical protein